MEQSICQARRAIKHNIRTFPTSVSHDLHHSSTIRSAVFSYHFIIFRQIFAAFNFQLLANIVLFCCSSSAFTLHHHRKCHLCFHVAFLPVTSVFSPSISAVQVDVFTVVYLKFDSLVCDKQNTCILRLVHLQFRSIT